MVNEIITTKDLCDPILKLFRFCGCDPKYEGKFIWKLMCYISMVSNAFLTVSLCMKLIKNRDSLAEASNIYVNYIVASQIGYKTYQLYVQRDKLSEMLDVFWNEFWPSDEIKILTAKYNKWHKMVMHTIKIYRGITFGGLLITFGLPFFYPVRTLPIQLWFFGLEPELLKSPCYELMYLAQSIFTGIAGVFTLVPLDMLFITMVGCSYIQFDMLRHKVLTIREGKFNEEDAYENLKKAIKYHNLLLNFMEKVESFFSRAILKQFLDAVTYMGVVIYLEQQEFNLMHYLSSTSNVAQNLFYCLCGQIIQDQSSAIADAAAQSNWESIASFKVRQGLMLMIQRAHRKVKISAGGFVDLSLESFVSTLQAAFSFFTFLRSTNRTEDSM